MRMMIVMVCCLGALYKGVNDAASITSTPGGAVVMSIVLCVIYVLCVIVILCVIFLAKDKLTKALDERTYY